MASLVKEVDKVTKASKDGESVVVLLDDDAKKSAKQLEEAAKAAGLEKVALTVNKSGAKPPAGLKINTKVKYTIRVYQKKKVVKNFAFNEIKDEDRKKVVEEATKLMGAKA